jgi:phosphate:Na+ symporter
VHLYFNLVGTIFFMLVFYILNAAIQFPFLGRSAGSAGIAVVHTAFNVGATLLLLPFSKWLEWLAVRTIPGGEEPEKAVDDPSMQLLDERFLEHPSFAVARVSDAVGHLRGLVHEALALALSLNGDYKKNKVKRIRELSQRVHVYEQALGTYLLRLCGKPLSEQDYHRLMGLMQRIGDLTELTDLGLGLAAHAKQLNRTYESFSKRAAAELALAMDAMGELLEQTFQALSEEDSARMMPQTDVRELAESLLAHNRKRVRKGKCTRAAGVALADILRDYEGIAARCYHLLDME